VSITQALPHSLRGEAVPQGLQARAA
jgi:hypothetical protein